MSRTQSFVLSMTAIVSATLVLLSLIWFAFVSTHENNKKDTNFKTDCVANGSTVFTDSSGNTICLGKNTGAEYR